MARLDQHIDAVRTRFLLQKLLHFGAWAILIAAAGLFLAVVTSRALSLSLPPKLLLWGAAALLAFGVAMLLAILHSPSRQATAVQIDQILGLQERFSTALLARGDNDAFAKAAVRDAERTADNVSIHKHFPFHFPKMAPWAALAIGLLLLADNYMPAMDLLGHEEKVRQAAIEQRRAQDARELVEKALAEVNTIPKVGAEEKAIAAARSELQALLSHPIKDPAEAARTAQKAMQDAQAMRDRIRDTQRSADAHEQAKFFKSLANSQPGGMLEETKKAMGEGKFDKAASRMQSALKDFDGADADKQAQMAKEMAQLADQLKKMANDPSVQNQIRKQLQQAGATPEQVQKMTDEMQKAAAGDKEAAQRVKEMAQNLARQRNGGLLPAPEQLAKLMQQMQQMQGQMNSQQAAQQLSQAAQQMANAMQKQANQGQQGKQGQQGQKGQQQQGGSEMADAQQAMQDALSQMESMQQEAQMADANSGEGDGDQQGQGGQWGNQQAQNNPGQGQGGNGPAGWNNGGQAMGDRNYKSPAPYSVKKEVSKGEMDPKGKMQAGWFVKSDSIKGESKEQLKEIIISSQRDATDDVEQERIPMQAQQVVRKYFDTMQNDAK